MPAPSEVEILYLVAIAHVWSRGTIFAWLRDGSFLCERNPKALRCRLWRSLFDCALCSGFWIGLLGHVLYLVWPSSIVALGTGAIIGTASLATYGAIRAIPVPPKKGTTETETEKSP